MKKYLLWICAAALLAAGTSCSDDPEVDSVGRVGLQQTSLTADGAGGELTLNVTSNAYWHIEFVDSSTGETIRWVSSSVRNGMGDAAVKLNVARNRSTSGRSAYVNVVTDSESSSTSILLSQGAGTIGGGDGYPFPISQTFHIDGSLALDNAFIEGAVCYFDDGMILRRTGSPVTMQFSTKTHTNPTSNWYFQRGVVIGSWETGDALQLEIPVKEELSGDLRYSYGSRRDGTQSAGHAWVFEWSSDGETWTQFNGTSSGGASDAVWKVIDFTIPADKKIPAGGKLWIRHRCTNGASASTSASNPTVAFQSAFCVTKASAEPTAVPAMDNQTVAFSTGFDDVINAKAAYIDLPLDFMSSWNAGTYSLPKALAEVVDVSECYTRPGFLQVGRGDEALITRYTQGAYTIKLATRFAAMNISKSDLKLTFLASAMVDAYGTPTNPGVVVKTDAASGATVDNEGKVEGVENNKFKEFTVYVRNATPATTITITSAAMQTSTDDVRFFLDDILLQVEGEPQRPSADDPVKADVSAIRARKGSGAVTISDNYYIQGRVVAVDNVPAGCFAVQDADAGIFVKLAGHSLAVGDQVEVVVKGAQLAADTDGLLVVTPTAADKVTKTDAASEVPAAKAISVADLKAGTYEAMLVSLPESQVVTADLAKTLSGSITLEQEDRTTYIMKTYASASFASTAVPQKRGALKGLAGASLLLPTALSDLAAMTGTRFGEAVYAIKPISGLIKVSRDGNAFGFRNVTYADNTVTYSSPAGCTITKVGNEGVAGCQLANTGSATIYDGRFLTTGWGGDNWQDNGLVFKIKATSRIVGNLRFGFGLFAAGTQQVPKNWKVAWSNDNVTWNSDVRILEMPFTGEGAETFALTTAANTRGYRMACFNVPESKAVAEGGFIYVKILQADNTNCHASGKTISTAGQLLFQHGFYLTTHEKGAYYTSNLPAGANVLLAEGFDDAFLAHDYFIPSWQMWTNLPNEFTMPDGWEKAGTVYEGTGYIRVGKNGTDAASSITTPALTALGEATANVTLKFKIGVGLGGTNTFAPDPCEVKISTTGGGTAGTLTPDLSSLLPQTALADINNTTAPEYENAYHRWYEVSVPVQGATKDTRITIGGTGRHFIDEIVITRD